MTRKWQTSALLLGAALMCVPAPAWTQPFGGGQDNSPKQDMKDAGHDAKNGARDAGRGVKEGTKKGYRKTRHGVKKGYRKSKNATKGAVNGAKEGAHQPQ